jgi:MoxR-like ATPase
MNIVEYAVRKNGFKSDINCKAIHNKRYELEEEMYNAYHIKTLIDNNQYYFKCNKTYSINEEIYRGKVDRNIIFYILISNYYTKNEFNPVNEQGNEIKWIKCNFDGQESCSIKINKKETYSSSYELNNDRNWIEIDTFKPKISFNQSDKKSDTNPEFVKYLQKEILELKITIEKTTEELEIKLKAFKSELKTPFVPDNIRDIALESITSQIKKLEFPKKYCEQTIILTDKMINSH